MARASAKGFTTVSLNASNPPVWLRVTPQQLRFRGYMVEKERLTLNFDAAALTETFVGNRLADRVATPGRWIDARCTVWVTGQPVNEPWSRRVTVRACGSMVMRTARVFGCCSRWHAHRPSSPRSATPCRKISNAILPGCSTSPARRSAKNHWGR